MEDFLKNAFPQDGKIKLCVTIVWKLFPLAIKSVSTSRNKIIFRELDFLYGFH